MRFGGVLVSIVALAPALSWADAPADPPAASPAPSVWTQLGWPTTSKSGALARAAHVVESPTNPVYIGKVAAGTRVAVVAVVDDVPTKKKNACSRWVQIAPRGFICASSVGPSDAAPFGAHLPVVAAGELVPGEYFTVDEAGVDLYKTQADAVAGMPTGELTGHVMLRSLETVWFESTGFYRTDKGFVPVTGVHALHPSDFRGVRLGGAVQLPISWAIAPSEKERRVFDAPKRRALLVRTVERYQQLVVRSVNNGYADIGDARHGSEWVAQASVATASVSARPTGVADNDVWIDIDLTQQTLVLFRGDTPLFATLVSTGKKRTPTPTGEFRVFAKAAVTAMTSEAGEGSQYDVSAVPWAMRFAKGVYLHAAYWHDGFGRKRSHGCVNLSPADARWLYDFLPPKVPDGWSELEIVDGPVVRVR